jgi:hypothetical protein
MKKLTLIASLLCFSIQQLYAQKDIELTFDNGETKTFRFDYDDPEVLPKWGLDLRFFGLTDLGVGVPGPKIIPYFRASYKLTFQGHLTIPYSKGMDENALGREEAMSTSDWSLMSHYIILSKDQTKEKNVAVDFGHSGGADVIYKAKLPRSVKRNLAVDGGLGGYRYYKDIELEREPPKNFGNMDSNYYIGMVSNTAMQLGLSYFKSESYKMTTDDKTRTYWNTQRIYARMTLGLINKYSITKAGVEVDKVADGFQQPVKSVLGYRIGMDRNFGIKNSGCSMIWGLEFGSLPGIKGEGLKNTIFMLHFGIGLAPKPDNL